MLELSYVLILFSVIFFPKIDGENPSVTSNLSERNRTYM